MTPSGNPSLIVSAGIAALVAWRIYARVRRMVGRQKLSRVRPWFTVVLFPLLLLALLLGTLAHPLGLLALVGGAALGIGLGIYGLKLTRFEALPTGLWYTPNAHLGIALSMLLVLRIAYRFAQGFLGGASFASPPTDFARSPLTLVIFGTLAGYYVTYAIGLLRWRAQVRASANRAPLPPAEA